MRKREIGKTGLLVSETGMGCMPLSITGRPSEADGIATIHHALEAGITLFDTADSYCLNTSEMGHNERVIAKALKDHPDVIVTTKGGLLRPDGGWAFDGRPERLKEACEASLRALGTESIDLYQFHHPDPKVTFADSIGALADFGAADRACVAASAFPGHHTNSGCKPQR
ncbi:aldo/keto reductase [Cohnella suwonensis]|uniref:Aldo/keto reductase n=1 Tax=Cohnella suwonensis TaxID=696072 RepID=A0ABW0LQZ9_9BACL